MTFIYPRLYYVEVIINVVTHGCPSQLFAIPGHSIFEMFSSLKLTRDPHRVVIDPLPYLGRCIHSVKVITLYETAKGFPSYFTINRNLFSEEDWDWMSGRRVKSICTPFACCAKLRQLLRWNLLELHQVAKVKLHNPDPLSPVTPWTALG